MFTYFENNSGLDSFTGDFLGFGTKTVSGTIIDYV
jgi:hypothetical protein